MANEQTINCVKQVLEKSKERKFRETIDLAINLKDIDLSVPKNRIDEDVQLPNGRGKPAKILVFGSTEFAIKAKAKADRVIQPAELNELAGKKPTLKKLANEFDFLVAEAPMMLTIGKQMGTVLGPRGKMPKPMPQNADPSSTIDALKISVKIRTKDKETFHVRVGTRDMPAEKIAENIDAVLKRLETKLERGKMNIHTIYVKTTMGAPVKLM